MTVETILAERGAIYGDYAEVAHTSQRLKAALRSGATWNLKTDAQRESLEMICSKLAREVNGLSHRDNYVDASGYAELIAKMMED